MGVKESETNILISCSYVKVQQYWRGARPWPWPSSSSQVTEWHPILLRLARPPTRQLCKTLPLRWHACSLVEQADSMAILKWYGNTGNQTLKLPEYSGDIHRIVDTRIPIKQTFRLIWQCVCRNQCLWATHWPAFTCSLKIRKKCTYVNSDYFSFWQIFLLQASWNPKIYE
jgi:hypothetical protein